MHIVTIASEVVPFAKTGGLADVAGTLPRALAKAGEMCVCEIVEVLGCDQSTVSKHLTLLKGAGLVEDRREGTWVYYRLACPCLGDFFRCIEDVISARLRRQQDSLNGLLGRKA